MLKVLAIVVRTVLSFKAVSDLGIVIGAPGRPEVRVRRERVHDSGKPRQLLQVHEGRHDSVGQQGREGVRRQIVLVNELAFGEEEGPLVVGDGRELEAHDLHGNQEGEELLVLFEQAAADLFFEGVPVSGRQWHRKHSNTETNTIHIHCDSGCRRATPAQSTAGPGCRRPG